MTTLPPLHLSLLPCMYDAWHPYKHAVLEVHKAFFPIFAALEHSSLQLDAQVYHHRKLLHREKVIAALLLVGDSIRDQIPHLPGPHGPLGRPGAAGPYGVGFAHIIEGNGVRQGFF